MTKPLIGMPTDGDPSLRSFKDYIDDAVAQAVIKAGGIPVMIPPFNETKLAKKYVERIDAVMFLGGPDIDPTLFGEEPIEKLTDTSMVKDKFEIEVAKQAYKAGKAMFGICRGIQIISLALGGTMYQDWPSQGPKAFVKHHQDAPIFFTPLTTLKLRRGRT